MLATILAAACLNPRWPAVAAVFIVLQVGTLLAALGTRQTRIRRPGFRFLSRASAILLLPAAEAPRPSRRTHLHLVP